MYIMLSNIWYFDILILVTIQKTYYDITKYQKMFWKYVIEISGQKIFDNTFCVSVITVPITYQSFPFPSSYDTKKVWKWDEWTVKYMHNLYTHVKYLDKYMYNYMDKYMYSSTCTCIYTQQIKVHVLIYMYMYKTYV